MQYEVQVESHYLLILSWCSPYRLSLGQSAIGQPDLFIVLYIEPKFNSSRNPSLDHDAHHPTSQ